jgi:hypothetical protein
VLKENIENKLFAQLENQGVIFNEIYQLSLARAI